jgi:hypothetical protein
MEFGAEIDGTQDFFQVQFLLKHVRIFKYLFYNTAIVHPVFLYHYRIVCITAINHFKLIGINLIGIILKRVEFLLSSDIYCKTFIQLT